MRTLLKPALSARTAAGGAQERWLAHLPRPRVLSLRVAGLVALIGVAAAVVAYMVVNVPLVEPKLSREEAVRYWGAAAIGALIVALGAVLVVIAAVRARRASSVSDVATTSPAAEFADRPLVPRSLGFERIPVGVVAIALAISLVLTAAFVAGAQLWVGGLVAVLPWIPLIALEARWKYGAYGIFAAFAMLVLLQVMHMGEHSMQLGQLLVHQGDLTQSHGVFGQLDFELVHFVTDTILWITLGLLLVVFRGRNGWLWVAFAAASLHQVEHFYLFWLYQTHDSVYAAGGFAGIMGEAGMIGSPLDRPYLHFTYNFIVVVPMVIALWDEARRVDRRADPTRP
jgi:hypothetical protein